MACFSLFTLVLLLKARLKICASKWKFMNLHSCILTKELMLCYLTPLISSGCIRNTWTACGVCGQYSKGFQSACFQTSCLCTQVLPKVWYKMYWKKIHHYIHLFFTITFLIPSAQSISFLIELKCISDRSLESRRHPNWAVLEIIARKWYRQVCPYLIIFKY